MAEAPPASSEPPKSLKKIDYTKTKERICQDCECPPSEPLDSKLLWDSNGKIQADVLREWMQKEGKIRLEDAQKLLKQATKILAAETTLVEIDAPITVCGDIHGQYYDLLKLFEVGGHPKDTRYLFLGDYVDRGTFSVECVFLLFAYKITFPDTFFLLRGNHECRHLTEYFTFKEECKKKYNLDIYDLFMDSFDALPLGALMNRQFLCIHGGISPEITTLDDIRQIDRFKEPPQQGPMCDILWADPMENFTQDVDHEFEFNETRGCSYNFSYQAACNFLDRNSLLCIIRAHEAQDAGYKMHTKSQTTDFPSVITLFSAPNYLDCYGNKGAILRYAENVLNIRQFNYSPHPYWLPNFMDVFTWSVPFVAEKVAEMLLTVLNLIDDDAEDEKEKQVPGAGDEMDRKQREALRAKVKSVSKMMKMYEVIRKEREAITQLKGLTADGYLPKGVLSGGGAAALKDAIGNFEKTKDADKLNEKRPPSQLNLQKVNSQEVLLQGAKAEKKQPSKDEKTVLSQSAPLKKVDLKIESIN